MKPTKNRTFCKDCGRSKMLFETEKKADTFIKFNSNEIEEVSGYKPERSYFCTYCSGWHVTSRKEDSNIKSKTEIILEKYKEEKEIKALIQEEKSLMREMKQQELNEVLTVIEKQISILEHLCVNNTSYSENLQKAMNVIENANCLKKFSFKGSNKRLRNAQEKIKILKGKTEIND